MIQWQNHSPSVCMCRSSCLSLCAEWGMLVFSVFVRSCSFMCLLIRSPVWVNIQDIFCVYSVSVLCCSACCRCTEAFHSMCSSSLHSHTLLRVILSAHRSFLLHTPCLTSTAVSVTAGQIADKSKGLCRIMFLSVFRFSWQCVLTRHNTTTFLVTSHLSVHGESENIFSAVLVLEVFFCSIAP